MRQRITFIHKPENGIDPESLNIRDDGVSGPDILAVREDRITLALEELPTDLSRVLKDSHEFHVRWVSPLAYETVSPLSSRLSPGFHLFYTPQRESQSDSSKACYYLRKAFGNLQCTSPESFITLPNDRFSHSAALQYYELLEDLSPFIKYASKKFCASSDAACKSRIASLHSAVLLDISYDTISHALKITAQWPHQSQALSIASVSDHRTEVGILTTDASSAQGPHEIGIMGVLTVLGEHKEPAPTVFSVPSRHRHYDGTFSTKFLEPTGFHPALQLKISSSKPPMEDAYCAIHTFLTLPKTIFADRYQLADELFLESKNLTALRYSSTPVDLEAPAYTTKPWGSSVLLELAPPDSRSEEWLAEIPLHLRYLAPTDDGYVSTDMPYPVVFWACAAEEGTKFPNNPFERVNIGYDALFGPRTVFWHVNPQPETGSLLLNKINIPVFMLDKAPWLRLGTAGAVLLGFGWVLWTLVAVYLASGYRQRKSNTKKEEKKEDTKKKQ